MFRRNEDPLHPKIEFSLPRWEELEPINVDPVVQHVHRLQMDAWRRIDNVFRQEIARAIKEGQVSSKPAALLADEAMQRINDFLSNHVIVQGNLK